MTKLPLISLFQIILDKKSALRFLIGTIFSLAFSIAVILSTIGLMDGYSVSLKRALAQSNGDLKLKARNGFYSLEGIEDKLNQDKTVEISSHILQIEAFALANKQSKGVLVKGIEPKSFRQVTGLNVPLRKNSNDMEGVIVGVQFAKKFDLKIGDNVVLAFNSKKARELGSASLVQFEIQGILRHGIFEKDMRFMYMHREKLQKILDLRNFTVNEGLIKVVDGLSLEETQRSLQKKYDRDFFVSTYWAEHEVLLDAVEIERDTISIALQLIVLVSVINIIAFMVFISEIKSQDIFMLRALGLSLKSFKKFWYCMLSCIWIVSCVFSVLLIFILDKGILQMSIFQLPGDIYKLSQLNILLKIDDYLLVFGLSLIWVFTVGFITIKRMSSKSLLSGLREEFS